MKKTAFCNREGQVSITFDIPRDAQGLEIKVKKMQTSMFKSIPLRIAHKTVTNSCGDDQFSLN